MIRYYPESDRLLQRRKLTLCANNGHSQVQKEKGRPAAALSYLI